MSTADRSSVEATDPPITVAIVSWNTRGLLRRCLVSLADDIEAGKISAWVVDNASSDGSAEMVRSEFPSVALIDSPSNLGFGRAVNEVAERTDSPWLAASNADVELTPRAVDALLDAGARDPRAGIVAPQLLMPDGAVQHSVHPFPTLLLVAVFNLGLHRLSRQVAERLALEGYWNPHRARRVQWAHGAFLLIRRTAFEAVGGFDANQWLYAEDLDLAWRLREAGWHTRYEPRAVVRHAVSASTIQAFGEERIARHIAATYSWMTRRRGPAITRTTAAFNVAGALARFALLAPLAAVRPDRFSQRSEEALRYVRLHSKGLRAPAGHPRR